MESFAKILQPSSSQDFKNVGCKFCFERRKQSNYHTKNPTPILFNIKQTRLLLPSVTNFLTRTPHTSHPSTPNPSLHRLPHLQNINLTRLLLNSQTDIMSLWGQRECHGEFVRATARR